MPHVAVKLQPGKIGTIEEVTPKDWMETVYKSDIQDKWDNFIRSQALTLFEDSGDFR